MAIRIVTSEYEARLAAVGGQSGRGKIERKTYRDGNSALRARYRGGAGEFELFINEASVGVLRRDGKKAELELDSRNGDVVPEVAAGDTAQLWAGPQVVAAGKFVED